MRGHIRQRSKGTWELIVDIDRDPISQTGVHTARARLDIDKWPDCLSLAWSA